MENKSASFIKIYEEQKKFSDKYKILKDKLKPYINYCTKFNGISINRVSSELEGCKIENVIDVDKRTIWNSNYGMPQFFIVDLNNLNFTSNKIKFLGISCWSHSPSNPKWVQLLVSNEQKKFKSIGNFYLVNKAGTQLLSIRHKIFKNIRYLKIVITETYGADCVYINNLFFLRDHRLDKIEKFNFLISESIETLLYEKI